MYQSNFLGPILLRFGFFVLNFYFTIRVTAESGWNFLSVILAMFAAREFVGTVQMGQVVSHINKTRKQERNKDNE